MNFIIHICIVAILFVAFMIASCGSVSVQKYPSDWPPLVAMSSTCTEVSGTYIDPNTLRWESINPQKNSKSNGTLEAAWPVFAFEAATVRPDDRNITSRAFSIAFGEDSSLVISYLLEDKVVSSRTFSKVQWSCEKEGVNLMTLEKTGVVMDKLPNQGVSTRTATINRIGDQLYVKRSDTTNAWLFHVIPTNYEHVSWFRFPVRSP